MIVCCVTAGPAAVQVELGSDAYASSLSVLGPPVATVGYSKIRISTAQYTYPVQTVTLNRFIYFSSEVDYYLQMYFGVHNRGTNIIIPIKLIRTRSNGIILTAVYVC